MNIDIKNKNKVYKIQAIFLHHTWSDFYTTEAPSNSNTYNNINFTQKAGEETDPQRLSLSSDSYIVNCYFYSITYLDSGAAIYLSKKDVHFLVEFSTFVECETTGTDTFSGGLYIGYADFAMNHVCALECNSYYRSSFTRVTNQGRTVNSIHLSSIAYCVSKDDYTMRHAYEYIDIQSVNLSHNTVNSYSALYCSPYKTNIGEIGTSISYSSFADNNATSECCIYFGSGGVNVHKIHESNVIYNTQPTKAIGTSGTLTLQSCTIIENKGSPVFSGSISLNKCAVSKDQYKDASNLDTAEVTTKSFINELTFIETGSCVNIFDYIEDLMPSKIQTKPLYGNIDVIYQYKSFFIQSVLICIFFSEN